MDERDRIALSGGMRDRLTIESVTDGLVSRTMRLKHEMIEAYIAKYLYDTGLNIEDVELVTHQQGLFTRCYVQKKTEEQ
jgi:hypothetical protein